MKFGVRIPNLKKRIARSKTFKKNHQNIMSIQKANQTIENWIREQSEKGIKLDSIFLSHLNKGLELKNSGWIPEVIQNTYLKEFEVPQILLFDLLTKKFPLVQTCQHIAEMAFVREASKHKEVFIVDIGIGRGFQMIRLLDALQSIEQIEKVTLIGIEISKAALDFTQSQLEQHQFGYKFEFQYHLMNTPVELLSFEMLKENIPNSCECLLVNASLTIHHLQKAISRQSLLSNIKALNPNLMILIEPDADTMNDNYEKRLLNAAVHFSALYNYVNTLDCLSEEESNNLKSFFANDFFDPVVLPDSHRFERLQTSPQWIDLARNTGLKSISLEAVNYSNNIPNIDFEIKPEGYLNFSHKGIPLISVIALA